MVPVICFHFQSLIVNRLLAVLLELVMSYLILTILLVVPTCISLLLFSHIMVGLTPLVGKSQHTIQLLYHHHA
jgi:hypothetical protein